jgi:hypothetical protein
LHLAPAKKVPGSVTSAVSGARTKTNAPGEPGPEVRTSGEDIRTSQLGTATSRIAAESSDSGIANEPGVNSADSVPDLPGAIEYSQRPHRIATEMLRDAEMLTGGSKTLPDSAKQSGEGKVRAKPHEGRDDTASQGAVTDTKDHILDLLQKVPEIQLVIPEVVPIAPPVSGPVAPSGSSSRDFLAANQSAPSMTQRLRSPVLPLTSGGTTAADTSPAKAPQEILQDQTDRASSTDLLPAEGQPLTAESGKPVQHTAPSISFRNENPNNQIEPSALTHPSQPKPVTHEPHLDAIPDSAMYQVRERESKPPLVHDKARIPRSEPVVAGPGQGTPVYSPAATHESRKVGDIHPVQERATEVLQRMDAALPPESTQLHAEARRLEVGVAAGDLGWVEVHATSGADGRVDATLHVQNAASAQVVAAHSPQITSFAQEHSIHLGQLSVGVGTGNSERRRDSPPKQAHQGKSHMVEVVHPATSARHDYYATDNVTLISLRA